MFAYRKYEELSYPKNKKMCDLILVTLSEMWPLDSHSSHENVSLSSSTFPLPSYKVKFAPAHSHTSTLVERCIVRIVSYPRKQSGDTWPGFELKPLTAEVNMLTL